MSYEDKLRNERREALGARVEEFYNKSHGKDGKFTSGSGGNIGGFNKPGQINSDKQSNGRPKTSNDLKRELDQLKASHSANSNRLKMWENSNDISEKDKAKQRKVVTQISSQIKNKEDQLKKAK